MPAAEIESAFPHLQQSGYRITSPADYRYNCIAWTAGDVSHWWEPSRQRGFYWPPDATREYTLESYVQAYMLNGYSLCDNDEYEYGFEKVAIFVDAMGIPSHAARQTESGAWTSKLGEWEDIEHNRLRALEGNLYGTVARILKRLR